MLVCRGCRVSRFVLLLALAQNSVAFVIKQTNFLAQRPPTSPHPLVRRSASRVVTCVNARMKSETTPQPDLAGKSRAGFLKGVFGVAAALTTAGAAPKEAPAIDLGPLRIPFPGAGKEASPEQAKVVEVAKYTRVVDKLVEDLQTGTLKGGDEDSAVVARVLENYLRPMQKTMLEVTPAVQVQLSGQKNKERSSLLPLLMKGHLLELEQACGTKDAKDQLKEVEEVKETLDEFVSLAKTRYDIKLPEVEAAPEGDQLGIFGCNFYGMKRMDGTNICQPDP